MRTELACQLFYAILLRFHQEMIFGRHLEVPLAFEIIYLDRIDTTKSTLRATDDLQNQIMHFFGLISCACRI
jgi:hypothetical protein